jgi:long-subunit acyl-CoA synthetase (AMP-forming)
MTNARIIIAHPSNVESALAAAELVGLPKSNIFIFGNETVNGILPYKQVFLSSERKASIIKMNAQEAKDTVAYLCFSSGTTGKRKRK